MVERVPEQNELHIRPAEERLAAVLNAVVEGVILTDDRGRIERMNSSAEDLTGWSAREALGKPLETVFPLLDPETRARVKGLLAEGPRKDSALGSTVPATLIARDRHETSIEYRIVPARSSSDSTMAFVLLFQELAQSHLLSREREQFIQLIEQSSDFVGLADLDGRLLYLNPSACRTLGFDRESDYRGVFFGTYVAEEYRDFYHSVFIPTLLRTGYAQAEMKLRNRKTGDDVDVYRSTFLIRDPRTNQPRGYGTISRDTRELTVALNHLRERERTSSEQARLLNLTRDAIMVRDANDRVTYWNAGAEAMYGFTAAEAVGRVTHSLLQTHSAIALEDARALCERVGSWSGELTQTTRDGRPIVTLSRWVVDRSRPDGALWILETNSDITARKAAEERLHASNLELEELTAELETRVAERTRQLTEANAELEAFAHSVAHDLRAPLRVMQGFSKALLEDYGPQLVGDGELFAQRIIAAAERMDRLISDLLGYARLSRTAPRLQPLALDVVIENAVAEIKSTPEGAHADIRIAPSGALVEANYTLLEQVLTNLLVNACKFVAPGVQPVIAVAAEIRAQTVHVSITDNGIGIAPEHHDRIFNVFERLHGQETYAGTGIGLALVRRALERMGGQVGVESRIGAGTRFWFDIRLLKRGLS
jgi:PAS domain S-box-containing protein